MYSFLTDLIREFLSTTWVEKVIDEGNCVISGEFGLRTY
jgi:hypothetical protein